MSITQVMNSSISIVTNCNHQTTNLLETMTELENPLDSLLIQFSLSRIRLEKPCDDNLFLALMLKIPRFKNVAPFFGFTQPEIEAIHQEYNNERSQRLHMLWQWKRKNGSNATYLALVTVFLKMEDASLAEFVVQHTKKIYLTESNNSQLNPEKAAMYPNWDTMTDGEREQVKYNLISQNHQVRQNYSSLIVSVLNSFEKRKVTVEEMKTKLLAYGVPEAASDKSPATLFPHFENDAALEDVFLTLCTRYSSWFNIQLLKVIVGGELGCEEDQQMLAEYEKDLYPYLERSIFEIPSKSFATQHESAGLVYLYFGLSEDHIPTGEDVFLFQCTISLYLEITEGLLQFIGFKDGNNVLIFGIPEAILQIQNSIEKHITFDPVMKAYKFNDDDLERIV